MFPIEPEEVDVLIKNQKRSIITYLTFSIFILTIGILLILSKDIFENNKLLKQNDDLIKQVIKVAGGFIASLTSFPLRSVLSCFDKISLLKLAQNKLFELQNAKIPKKEYLDTRNQIFGTIEIVISKSL
ncbi:MAG TPA: hypothetical protein VGI43_14820 [Mucilaginibacter sp.]|jgi:hypothetical protein